MRQYERVFNQKAIHSWEEQSTCWASHITENTQLVLFSLSSEYSQIQGFRNLCTHLHECPCSQPCPYYSRAKKLLALREKHISWTQGTSTWSWSSCLEEIKDAIQPQLFLCKQLNLPFELLSHLCTLRSMSHCFGKESGNKTKRKYTLTHILPSLGTH